MADVRKAKSKIDRVQLKWFNSDPVMLGVWCLVEKEPDKNQKTMGIDSRSKPPCIKFNPNFVNALTEEQLEMVMAAEGFKLLLRHPTTRLKEPKQISSLASSVTVDQMVAGNLLNISEIRDMMPTPKMFGLDEGKFYEEYFRKLMEMSDEVNDKIKEIWNSLDDKEKQELIERAMSNNNSGEDSEAEGVGQDGSSGDSETEQKSGNSENQGTDEDGFQKYDGDTKSQDGLKDYFDPNGTSNQEWGENDMLDADIKNMIDEKQGSSKQWGKFTQDHMSSIIAANKPKISYKEVIKRFNTSIISGKSVSSRMKVNRRYDLASPGYRREYQSKLIFAVDTSGSMTEDDLKEGFAVINNICKHSEIEYVLFDTSIKLIEKKRKNAQTQFKVKGRGGTDFQEVVDYAEKKAVDGLVIFTDGCASAPTKPKHTKVLWLLHSKEQRPPVDWGFKTHLNRFEK